MEENVLDGFSQTGHVDKHAGCTRLFPSTFFCHLQGVLLVFQLSMQALRRAALWRHQLLGQLNEHPLGNTRTIFQPS